MCEIHYFSLCISSSLFCLFFYNQFAVRLGRVSPWRTGCWGNCELRYTSTNQNQFFWPSLSCIMKCIVFMVRLLVDWIIPSLSPTDPKMWTLWRRILLLFMIHHQWIFLPRRQDHRRCFDLQRYRPNYHVFLLIHCHLTSVYTLFGFDEWRKCSSYSDNQSNHSPKTKWILSTGRDSWWFHNEFYDEEYYGS